MIKRSSRVLSMVMAFSMATSVFVAPNAFALYDDSVSSLKAKVTTTVIEKNANGVYEQIEAATSGASVKFATVTYSGTGFTDEANTDKNAADDTGNFIIGETYDVKITQNATQAKKYDVKGAKIGVDLKTDEDDGSAYYNEYVEDVALTKSTSGGNTVHTGSFTAFGAANTALSSDVSALKLYIDVETKASNVTAVAGTSSDATVKPLDADLKETDSIVLKAGQDAYFRVTANSGYYINYDTADDVKASAYVNGSTAEVSGSGKSLELDTSKGLDIYKLAASDVTTLLGSAGSNGSVKISAKATALPDKSFKISLSDDLKNSGNYTLTYADDSTFPGSAKKGKVLKITSKVDNIDSINFGGTDVKVYYSGSKTASFIAPGVGLEIKGINTASAATKTLTLKNLVNVELVGGTSNVIEATSGSVKQVTFKPLKGMYPELTDSEEYKIPYVSDGWKFDFLGVKDGNLVYNVTFGTTQKLDLYMSANKATDKTDKTLRYPSVTSKFVPAVKFDQVPNANNSKANVKLKGLETEGVVTVGKEATVKVDFNDSSLKLDYIDLAGSRLTTSGTNKITPKTDGSGTSNAEAKFTIAKAVDENGKGLLLDFDADFLKGNIDIDKMENGTVIASLDYTDPKSNDRVEAGTRVYLIATPKAGYKLNSIAVKDEVTGESVSLTKTVNDNLYYMTMPEVDVEKVGEVRYGNSVLVKATFVKDSSVAAVKNLAPEADKAKNNGYAKASFGTASQIKVGEEFNVEYIANDNCKLLSTTVQYTNTSGKTVTLEATKVDGNKYTYKAPSDVEDAISIGAKFAKTSDIIKVENKTAEADKETNNGYLTIKEAEVVAGGTITGTATAVEGYKVASVSYSYTDSDKKTVTKDVTVEENAFSITVPKDVVAEGTISISAKFEKSGEEAAKNAWVKDGDNWTYWKDGKQVTGWFQDGGIDWFYADVKTGFMKTGWFQDGGDEWFYADVKTGAMKTGWFQDGGSTWYYCFTQEDAVKRGNRAGVMATNQWVLSNEKWYYLNNTGAMETNNWVKDADDALESWVGEDGAFVPAE